MTTSEPPAPASKALRFVPSPFLFALGGTLVFVEIVFPRASSDPNGAIGLGALLPLLAGPSLVLLALLAGVVELVAASLRARVVAAGTVLTFALFGVGLASAAAWWLARLP